MRILSTVLLLVLTASRVFAQGSTTNIRATDASTGVSVNVGDSANTAVRVTSPTLATAANQTTMITSLDALDALPKSLGATTTGSVAVGILGAVTTGVPVGYSNGQMHPISLDTSGNVRVAVMNAASGGVSAPDETPFADAVSSGTSIMAVAENNVTTTVTEGYQGMVGMTTRRHLKTALYSATTGAALVPTVDVIENQNETDGVAGPLAMGVRRDTPASSAAATGRYATINNDANGFLYTRGESPIANTRSERIANTDGASTASTVFTALASNRNYITGIHVFRTDAGTTPIYVDFRDGTGGAILWTMALPPGGGSTLSIGNLPYFRTSLATALAFDVSAPTTTVIIDVTGFQSPL